jgi:hypothetical protein
MADVGSYRQWWPWLRSFEALELERGDVWRCSVSPPLPYTVTFAIAFDDVFPEERIIASVSGDIVGTAELELTDTDAGCDVEVRSDLQPRSAFLRLLATTVPPVARYGHDWILATGATQFEARALTPSADAPDTTR